MMKRFTCIFVLLLLVGVAPETWAGAADEVAEIGRQRTRAFIEGNLDAYTAAFADNAVATFSITPFRVEGKDAIRGFYENLFQTYPTRRVAVRQPLIRVYNNETTVITNNYTHGMLVDRNGQATNIFLRISATWLKIGGQWQIVDQHASRLPASQ